MGDAQDPEAVIATLQQAKTKLAAAQRHTFEGLSRLSKVRESIQSALGRLGQGNPAIAVLHDTEQTIKARAVEIAHFSTRIDKAIAEVRHAASGGGSGGSGGQSDGPAPGPA